MMVGLGQRARRLEDKQARRSAILEAAAGLLGRRQYASITMAEVARHCGLAKGTLYLYFKSKEELFLATLERELVHWFDAFGAELARHEALDPDTFGRLLARSIGARERLTDLLPIVHVVLEHNIEHGTALAFKRTLLERLSLGAQMLERVLPGLSAGAGLRLLLRIQGLVLGLEQMAYPAPSVAGVLERQELAQLRIDLESDLAEAVADLVRGTLMRSAASVTPRRST
jgi:AcrR family transcriptional regulator